MFDNERFESDEFGNVPYDPDSKPDGYLGEIFEDHGWVTWSDFYADHLGLNGDPESSRPPSLGDIDDLIIDLHDRGILDYARFEFDGDYVDYEIDVDTGDVT